MNMRFAQAFIHYAGYFKIMFAISIVYFYYFTYRVIFPKKLISSGFQTTRSSKAADNAVFSFPCTK